MHPGQEYPPCDIRIDKGGVWHYRGQEMFRKEIVNYFYQHLKQDPEGAYMIDLGEDCCYIEVEDAPFVVQSVQPSPDDSTERPQAIRIRLSDDTLEELDPSTLSIGTGNVMYCRVKNGAFRARFSRPAYYQLADHITYDEASDRYEIHVGGRCHIIRVPRP